AWFTDDGRGISPMLRLIGENRGLRGYAAADIIVGKAAAMLFVKAGIAAVYGEVMSKAGKAYLEAHGIPCAFGTLTENIINRKGDGVCPMEQAVAALDDAEAGCAVLRDKLNSLRNKA
ncbi:MAG: DUF1893 domain-containing protein, partial [Ruminococcus sp.]|nr:DUF1893 domain-containing protein [Ruminococcus sp.]